MGFVDKLKFWKKEEDFGDLGNIEDFGDFNLEEKPSLGGSLGGAQVPGQGAELGTLPSFEQRIGTQTIDEMQPATPPPAMPPSGMEQYPGSQAAMQEGFAQTPSMQPAQALYPQRQGGASQPKYPQAQSQYGQAAVQQPEAFEQAAQPRLTPAQLGQGEMSARYQGANDDIRHDLELMHSKLDTIKASLDSINARLANLERIAAGPENRSRYQW
ncbi:hypothetical protein HY772_02860 [Candidatus Woesearchaeota archaeon]|nr:hypothetical protein [Candidatus Woesearchaeota archaeon]